MFSCNGQYYLSMTNGILDIEALLAGSPNPLIDHSPKWFSPIAVDYPFDENAYSKEWEKILQRNLDGDQERINLLQEWCGYCLTPDTNQQKFLVIEGEGANGKSVYCAVLEALLCVDNCSHISLEAFGQRFQLTETLGKLANIISDCGELDKTAEGFLKGFVSGDKMFFDRKGISGISAAPTARIVLATNNRPRFSDKSSGIWRRMMIVPFDVTIPKKDQVRGMDKPEYWTSRPQVLSGIFNWAIAGLARLRSQGGFTEPAVSAAALEEYRKETNPARAFLLECCDSDPVSEEDVIEGKSVDRMEVTTLYAAFRNWCKQSGLNRPVSNRVFGKEVSRVTGCMKRRMGTRDDRSYIYDGISLKLEFRDFIPQQSPGGKF